MADGGHHKVVKPLTGSGGTLADPRSPAGGCGPGNSVHYGPLGAGLHFDLAEQGLHPAAPANKFGSVLVRAADIKSIPVLAFSKIYNDHNLKVMARINDFIDMVNDDGDFGKNFAKNYHDAMANGQQQLVQQLVKRKAAVDGTVAEKLDWCWAENIKLRQADSTDTIGRDADYYFAARHSLAADSSTLKKFAEKYLGLQAWTFYSALKLGAKVIGHDEWMRTDPNKPNAAPGGIDWVIRGANEGIQDVGQLKGNVTKHSPTAVAIWEYTPVVSGAPAMGAAAFLGLAFTAIYKLIESLPGIVTRNRSK